MGVLAQIMHAVARAQQKLLAINHLQDLTLQHENQLFARMLHGFRGITRRHIHHERGQLVPRKFGPDLLIDDRGARN